MSKSFKQGQRLAPHVRGFPQDRRKRVLTHFVDLFQHVCFCDGLFNFIYEQKELYQLSLRLG